MLDPETAWQRIASEIESLSTTQVSRQEAYGRILGQDRVATVDMPPADVSAMDGYVAAGEVPSEAPHPVRGVSAAGHVPDFSLQDGGVAKIMTGAQVPMGGDRVIPIEHTDGGKERVVIHRLPQSGAHIRRRAEVVEAGAPLLKAGHLLTPGAISLLASHGYSDVPVIRAPKVAILTTGDELVPPEMEPGQGQLRDSNTAFLLAAGRSMGLCFQSLGIARDRREDLREKISSGLEADVLLLCGGVSKGDFDLVEDVLDELGCRRLFDSVAMQPGKPLVASRHSKGFVFGLPGNPGSVMMTFWLFVRPTLNILAGSSDGFWNGALDAELTAPLPATKGRDRFFIADLERRDGRLFATPGIPRGSHDVASFARGSAIVRTPKHSTESPAGERCSVLPLD